jgi:hypothetical protein
MSWCAESIFRDLKLTRFRGYRTICVGGVHDSENETRLPA